MVSEKKTQKRVDDVDSRRCLYCGGGAGDVGEGVLIHGYADKRFHRVCALPYSV